MSSAAREEALRRLDRLTKPPGSLGQLEQLVAQLAGVQGTSRPRSRPAAALLFAADHPVTAHGVSAWPQEVTRAMVTNLATGGAAASVACAHLKVPLTVIDAGVEGPPTPGVHRHPVAEHREGDLVTGDAMEPATYALALAAGRDAVLALAEDTRVLVLGEMGIGNSTLAAAIASAVLGLEPEATVGRGAGASDEVLSRKRSVVARAVARCGGRLQGDEALRRLGGRELAAIAGAARAAAERHLMVLVDGAIVTAALAPLVLEAPALKEHLIFAHRSADRSHGPMVEALGVAPLLSLGMRLGEGTGALAALPFLDLACALYDGMATFDEAHVPEES